MDRHERAGTIRVSLADWIADDEVNNEPRHAISVVTARAGVARTTLLRYEEWGVVTPARRGKERLYSEADLDRLMRAQRLIDDLGVNIAGAAAALHLREQIIALQRELSDLRSQSER